MGDRLNVLFAVTFLIVDVLLVVVMFQHLGSEASKATSGSDPLPESTAAAQLKTTGDVRLWAGKGTLVRTRMGTCADAGRPLIEVSFDNGETFDEVAVPVLKEADATKPGSTAESVRTILRIDVESSDDMTIVAGDEACKPRQYTTGDGGEKWDQKKRLDGWYLDATGDDVVSPSGPSNPGCEFITLASFSDTAARGMCLNGTVRSTVDGGTTWIPSGRLNGLKAATFPRPTTGYAIADDGKCSRAFSTVDGGVTWVPAGCVDEKDVTTMTGTKGRLIAAAGDVLVISTDQGETWGSPS